MTNCHPLFSIELRNIIISLFLKDPYNTAGHYQANRVHVDGTKGWPDNKIISQLSDLRDHYKHDVFDATFQVLLDSNIVVKETINEYDVYSLSGKYIIENNIINPFPDKVQSHEDKF